jgi:hypothetical protein
MPPFLPYSQVQNLLMVVFFSRGTHLRLQIVPNCALAWDLLALMRRTPGYEGGRRRDIAMPGKPQSLLISPAFVNLSNENSEVNRRGCDVRSTYDVTRREALFDLVFSLFLP